jgi:hypothetical protein
MSHAYPVLEAGIEDKVERALEYLSGFSNLSVVGRNGRFVYAHVHDMLRFGLEVTIQLADEARETEGSAGRGHDADGSRSTRGS